MRLKWLCCFFFGAAALSAASLEQDARALLARLETAAEAKDVTAMAGLFDDDAVFILTTPQSGPSEARFFSKAAYFSAWKERSVTLKSSIVDRTIVQLVKDDAAQKVYVAAEAQERAKIELRSEWTRTNEYWVFEAVNGKMRIKQLVAELVFYFPDVPVDVKPTSAK